MKPEEWLQRNHNTFTRGGTKLSRIFCRYVISQTSTLYVLIAKLGQEVLLFFPRNVFPSGIFLNMWHRSAFSDWSLGRTCSESLMPLIFSLFWDNFLCRCNVFLRLRRCRALLKYFYCFLWCNKSISRCTSHEFISTFFRHLVSHLFYCPDFTTV